MAASPSVIDSKNYASRFAVLAWASLAQLVRSPSHSRRAEAARRAARYALWLSAALGVGIVVLMFAIDAWEIAQMPKRGTPSLWWLRIVTELYMKEMSPTQYYEDFGGATKNLVHWHFKQLASHGWLRKVKTEKRQRGRGRSSAALRGPSHTAP